MFTNKNSLGAPILPVGPTQQCWNRSSGNARRRSYDHPTYDYEYEYDWAVGDKKDEERTAGDTHDEERTAGDTKDTAGQGPTLNVILVVSLTVIWGACLVALLITLTFSRWKKYAFALKMRLFGRRVDERPVVTDDACACLETEPCNHM